MAFTVKKGDLVYAADATLGFVSAVFLDLDGDDGDNGWARVSVMGQDKPVYFAAADIVSRDESVPAVLLSLTYAEATDAARQHAPDAIASGRAHEQDISPLEEGRPEAPSAG